jgi:hypothetical protein
MSRYSLVINGQQLVDVKIETPAWLPVRPHINQRWLRSLIAQALGRYFSSCVVRA